MSFWRRPEPPPARFILPSAVFHRNRQPGAAANVPGIKLRSARETHAPAGKKNALAETQKHQIKQMIYDLKLLRLCESEISELLAGIRSNLN